MPNLTSEGQLTAAVQHDILAITVVGTSFYTTSAADISGAPAAHAPGATTHNGVTWGSLSGPPTQTETEGMDEDVFHDEQKPHSLRSLLKGGYQGNRLLSPESAGFTKDDNLFNYQAKIIRQLADEGSCVLIGRCADYILRDQPDVVRVFVHAPADFCLQEAMKVNSQQGCPKSTFGYPPLVLCYNITTICTPVLANAHLRII